MHHRVCMASDFFYPNMGGVEEHLFQLSQCLMGRGHQVVIITHSYGDRVGVRYMTNGLKVYYLPIRVFYNQSVLPTMVSSLPLIRYILLRERITIVHGHSAFSTLAHETMFIGRLLGLKSVFTDHSLFGFADASAVITNKFLELSLADCNHCICVSHTGKENTVLRARVKSNNVSVIPNAVDSSMFTPDPSRRESGKTTIIIVSRLVYRKGVDLMAGIIPEICWKYPDTRFLIAGDGPKRIVLEEVRERQGLQDRVTLLGMLEHSQVRDVLVKGDIFLNTSLTEAYCMAIVEAVSCGLQVVTTRVGGIPEVLPPDLMWMAEPDVPSLVTAVNIAIETKRRGKAVDAQEAHDRVAAIYNWKDVAQRTERVYNSVTKKESNDLRPKLKRYLKCGAIVGKVFLLLVVFCHLYLRFLDWLVPRKFIDFAKDYPRPYSGSANQRMKKKS